MITSLKDPIFVKVLQRNTTNKILNCSWNIRGVCVCVCVCVCAGRGVERVKEVDCVKEFSLYPESNGKHWRV